MSRLFRAAPAAGMDGHLPLNLSGPSMSERKIPPFRADHVGSLIRPDALIEARGPPERGAL
jgi:hypothetical protein